MLKVSLDFLCMFSGKNYLSKQQCSLMVVSVFLSRRLSNSPPLCHELSVKVHIVWVSCENFYNCESKASHSIQQVIRWTISRTIYFGQWNPNALVGLSLCLSLPGAACCSGRLDPQLPRFVKTKVPWVCVDVIKHKSMWHRNRIYMATLDLSYLKLNSGRFAA